MKLPPYLRAERFWALVIGATSLYAQQKGWIGDAEMAFIGTVTGGFITVRTIDRATEQKILAEAVGSKQISVRSILEIPPSKTDNMSGGVSEPDVKTIDHP